MRKEIGSWGPVGCRGRRPASPHLLLPCHSAKSPSSRETASRASLSPAPCLTFWATSFAFLRPGTFRLSSGCAHFLRKGAFRAATAHAATGHQLTDRRASVCTAQNTAPNNGDGYRGTSGWGARAPCIHQARDDSHRGWDSRDGRSSAKFRYTTQMAHDCKRRHFFP